MLNRFFASGKMIALFPLLVALGCSNHGPKMGSVTGVVTTDDGQPVAQAQIAFIPDVPGIRAATDVTDANGAYRLSTFKPNDGALVGTYKVTVAKIAPYEGKIPEGMGGAYEEVMEAQGKPLLPVRYFQARTSGLVAEVKSGSNRHDFILDKVETASTSRR